MQNRSLLFTGIISLSLLALLISCGHPRQSGNAVKPGDSLQILIRTISEKITSSPSDGGLYNRRASLFLEDHQNDKALNDINKAIQIDPRKPAYYITLSDIYLNMGKPDKCGEALKKAIELDPQGNEGLLKYARLNLIIKEYKTAFEYVRKCLTIDQVNPRAWFILGLTHLETGDTIAAVNEFKKTVDQDQNHYEALMQLGELYAMKKDNLSAGYYQNALRVKPNDKVALYLLGMFYQDTKQFDQAVATYQQLQKADSTNRNAPYNIGYIYLVYLKDLPKAADYFSKAMKADPGYYEALYNRGYSFELMGDNQKAYDDYQKTLKIHPNYEKAVDGLNRLDRVMGKAGK